MTVIAINVFSGENRAVHPTKLKDTVGTVSNNQKPGRGDLRPWKAPFVVKQINDALAKTIYRMGRSLNSDTSYWMTWPGIVHAVLAPNADETSERIYYTGDGAPKWTDLTKAIGGTTSVNSYRDLGIPVPSTAVTCTVEYAPPDPNLDKFEFKVYESYTSMLKKDDKLKISVLDLSDQFINVAVDAANNVTLESLQLQFDPLIGLSAKVVQKTDTEPKHLWILSDSVGKSFTIEKKVSTTNSYAATDITYGSYIVQAVGAVDKAAEQTLYPANPMWEVDAHYEVTVNAAPAVSITVMAGAGTLPAAISAQSLSDAFSTVSGVTTKIAGDSASITIATDLKTAGASLKIRKIIPKTTDKYTTLITASKVVADNAVTEAVFYTYTYVSDIGEESAPATPSAEVTHAIGEAINIAGMAGAPTGAQNIVAKRIYRTKSGSSATSFFFLDEVGVSISTYKDTGKTLGEVLPTTSWLPPPSNLKCLTGLWNGMMAAISGRGVRFCEAYVPYAWPVGYEILPSNVVPVALGTFGQTLVVLTDDNPSLITGGSPEAMDEHPLEFSQSCISVPSVVSMGHGVAWSSPDGLAYIGTAGPRLLTDGLMTRDDWQAINPTTLIGCMYERRYWGFYKDANSINRGFVIDPQNPDGIYFLDSGADAVFVDPVSDTLYVKNNAAIQKFEHYAQTVFMTAKFKSKLFRLPKPVTSFAYAEVRADGYPLTFSFYADGVLRHTQSVTSKAPFRLPSGYTAQEFQLEVSSQYPVQNVAVAHSVAEIAQV